MAFKLCRCVFLRERELTGYPCLPYYQLGRRLSRRGETSPFPGICQKSVSGTDATVVSPLGLSESCFVCLKLGGAESGLFGLLPLGQGGETGVLVLDHSGLFHAFAHSLEPGPLVGAVRADEAAMVVKGYRIVRRQFPCAWGT